MKCTPEFYKRKQDKDIKRRVGIRGKPKDTFLIVCEGEKTEPNYFNGFRLSNVRVRGSGCNTKSLVEETIYEKKLAASYGTKYDQVWCVFDKDSFPDGDFNDAIAMAGRNKIAIAYTNQAFELWYLLHFDYHSVPLERDIYQEKLTALLGEKYKKGDNMMYDKLVSRQGEAIKNAKKLRLTYDPYHNPAKDNPCTTVHILVEELNKFLRH